MNLREGIQMINKDALRSGVIRLASVVSVEDDTCTVMMIDTETEIAGVRLQVNAGDGALYTPAVGSVVMLAKISDFDFGVVMFSALAEIKFLDGSFGGLTKTQELKTQLDKTTEIVSLIMQTLMTWTPVTNDGGAALKAAAIAALTGKVVGDYSNIENDKITHGNV
jgi:hypothetical protein